MKNWFQSLLFQIQLVPLHLGTAMDTKIPLNAMALAILSMARDDARSSEDCLYLNVWRGGCI